MKKAYTAAAGLLALVLCLTAALASGGSDQDPLISLSYLEGAFSQSVDAAVDSRLDEWDRQAAASMERQLDAMGSGQVDGTASEADLKEGDVLAGATGLTVTPLAGEVRLEIASGAVVDATEGREVPGGTVLDANHLYIVAEGSSASFVVDSPTAVLSYQGGGALSLSYGAPDYYAIARALRQLGLFRGTGSGIGEGFDLHQSPTRGEGLVMFIRILGEEDQAMAWTGEHPFTDVPAWLDPYVAWAWERGYTNGVSETIFGAGEALTPQAYMEFLLRALGYSVAGIHDYTTSLDRALDCGALTAGEARMLAAEPFLRCHVAYVSWYSLDTLVSGSGQTLAQRLEDAGLFTADELAAARSGVTSLRLS